MQATSGSTIAAVGFANYQEEAGQVDADVPSLFFVASHWAETARPYLAEHRPAPFSVHRKRPAVTNSVAPRHLDYPMNASAETPKRLDSADTWRRLSRRLPPSTLDTTL